MGSNLQIEVGNGILQFKFGSEYQLKWVEKNGPWNFDNNLLLLGRWRRGLTAFNIIFTHSLFWVQIWELPFEMMDKEVGMELGNSLGKFMEANKRLGQADQARFMRIRVDLPLDKPLRRGGKIVNAEGGKFWITFKYERLPCFCYLCGRMGHDEKHCPNISNWRNALKQYGDWLRANGKSAPEKSRSTSCENRDEVGRNSEEDHVQTMAENMSSPVTIDDEGSSGICEKPTQSDKGSKMGREAMGSLRCQSAQKPDGWNNSIQIHMDTASGQSTMARASLVNSPNEPIEVANKELGTEYALSIVGQPVQEEKEMMDVTSPLKTKADPTNVTRAINDKPSPTGEGKGRARRHLKKK